MDSDSQKKTDHESSSDTPPKLNAESETPETVKKPGEKNRKFTSFGEHAHKIITYWGIDGGLNTVSAVAFSYWAKFTKTGNQLWTKPIDQFFRKTLKPIFKDEANLSKSAGYGALFASIMMGGTLIIPPLLVLENKKTRLKIVKFFDRLRYGKDKVENDSRLQQSYAEVENAPKKDFSTGMLARTAALIPLLALVLIPTAKAGEKEKWYNFTRRQTDEKWFGPIGKVGEWTGDKLGLFQKLPKNKKHYLYHEGLGVDLGLVIPYATVLHPVFFNFFASLKNKRKNKGTETDTKQQTQTAGAQSETVTEKSEMKMEATGKNKSKPGEPSPHMDDAKAASMPPDLSTGRLQQSPSP